MLHYQRNKVYMSTYFTTELIKRRGTSALFDVPKRFPIERNTFEIFANRINIHVTRFKVTAGYHFQWMIIVSVL